MPIGDNFTPEEAEELISGSMEHTGLKRADAERLLDRDLSAKRDPLLEGQWVRNLRAVCDALREGRAEPEGLFISVFWIRLYGVLVDLRGRYRKSAEAHEELVTGGGTNAFSVASADVFYACDAVYQSLSDEELIYAVFIRHTEAHVYQTSFDYSVERGNPAQRQPAALRTKQMVPTVRRHIDVDEVHRIVDAVLQRPGYNEARVAVNMAHKVGPHVEALERAIVAMEAQREEDRKVSDARRPMIRRSWLTRR